MFGWLYADLTLVLFIASMGQFRTPAPAEAKPRPSVSPSPSPTPTPTTRERMGLAPKAITFTVRVDRQRLLNGNPRTQRRFERDVSRQLEQAANKHARRSDTSASKARAGLAIIFGFDADIGTAQRVARSAKRISKESNQRIFANSIIKAYGSTTPADKVEYEIYFYW
jgi:hypothetical protein